MLVLLSGIAVVAMSGFVAVVALVSVASRREDSDWSLGEPARGLGRALARRVVGFHSRGTPEWSRPWGFHPARTRSGPPARGDLATSGTDKPRKTWPDLGGGSG